MYELTINGTKQEFNTLEEIYNEIHTKVKLESKEDFIGWARLNLTIFHYCTMETAKHIITIKTKIGG